MTDPLDELVDAVWRAHDPVARFAEAVSAVFADAAQPRANAAPRTAGGRTVSALNMRTEPRQGRSCALILTGQDGSEIEAVLGSAVCRELSGVLTRAAR